MLVPNQNYALDDPYFRDRLKRVIDEWSIEVVVETGLNEGKSTAVFANMARFVIGIDVDPICCEITKDRLNDSFYENARIICGNAPDVLLKLRDSLPKENTLYFQ